MSSHVIDAFDPVGADRSDRQDRQIHSYSHMRNGCKPMLIDRCTLASAIEAENLPHQPRHQHRQRFCKRPLKPPNKSRVSTTHGSLGTRRIHVPPVRISSRLPDTLLLPRPRGVRPWGTRAGRGGFPGRTLKTKSLPMCTTRRPIQVCSSPW